MKIGVVGRGRLGSLLLQRDGFFSLKCDLTDQKSIWNAVESLAPDIIVNLAAISNLDDCEKDYNRAIKVNVDGTTNLHKVFGDKVVTFSTDHVFNGRSCRNKESSLVS
ncbi:MAG: NAD-dependent epimerase/dehydratase family protein, partial [Alphaproteobacteria bacterium]